MEQMTTLRDLVGQVIQKRKKKANCGRGNKSKRKYRYWRSLICYDVTGDDTIAIHTKSESIPDKICDVPLCENSTPLNALNKHSEIVVNSNNDNSLSDDDSPYGEDIDYVDASPPDAEIVSLEVVEIIYVLRDNPTPFSDIVIKSTSTFSNLFLEETNNFDNSIPEF
ncbi:hypothetical protein Tco_1106307 [Tanacetum coccineum]